MRVRTKYRSCVSQRDPFRAILVGMNTPRTRKRKLPGRAAPPVRERRLNLCLGDALMDRIRALSERHGVAMGTLACAAVEEGLPAVVRALPDPD